MNQATLSIRVETTTKKPGPPFTMIVLNNGEEEAALPAGTKKTDYKQRTSK